MSLRDRIEALAASSRTAYGDAERALFGEFRTALSSGQVRAAERGPDGAWRANTWVKQGILLGFRMGVLRDMSADGAFRFFDKDTYPVRDTKLSDRVRIVPGGSTIRDGAYVAPGVVCMPPMYVNVGAYVDEGTLIDSHALVGSCAQIGRRVRGIEKSAIRQFFDRAPAGSINFGLGEPDLPTPDVVRQAAIRAIQDERNGYTTHAGLVALRELVAGEYASLGAAPDRVIITAGSQEALYLALTTLVDEGDEVLLPDPGFVAYPTIVRMAGGRPVFYKLPAARDFGLDIDDFRRKLSKRTKVVVCI